MSLNIAYIAIDLHSNRSVIGYMNKEGNYLQQKQFSTSAAQLIGQVVAIPARSKHLTIEQGNMTHWAASQLEPYVDKLIICDPTRNNLIYGQGNKDDHVDTVDLCELLRLGALKEVYSDRQMGHRRLFYWRVKEYERITKNLTNAKRQLQAALRHWRYNLSLTKRDYRNPEGILDQISEPGLQTELRSKGRRIGFLADQKAQQLARITRQGKRYWEISEFKKMAGMGPVTSHTFSAYVQTPHRFARKGQLIKFSRLAVRHHSSDGRSLRAEQLHSSLKNVSYTAWNAAMKGDNEVSRFYQVSLARSNNATNARLNTQCKILISLWSLWKHKQSYCWEKFFSGRGDSAR